MKYVHLTEKKTVGMKIAWLVQNSTTVNGPCIKAINNISSMVNGVPVYVFDHIISVFWYMVILF